MQNFWMGGWEGYWGPSCVNDRFLFKIPLIWKVQLLDTLESKQPDENITTWNCSQAPLITALYHVRFSFTKLTNSEHWIFSIQKVLLSNHQKLCLTWLINQNLFCLRYRRCSIQAGRHCLGKYGKTFWLLGRSTWHPATRKSLPAWNEMRLSGGMGRRPLQSQKSCEHQSSWWKSLRCCLGNRIWWHDEI